MKPQPKGKGYLRQRFEEQKRIERQIRIEKRVRLIVALIVAAILLIFFNH